VGARALRRALPPLPPPLPLSLHAGREPTAPGMFPVGAIDCARVCTG